MTKKQSCCFTGHRPQSLPFRFNENDERCIDLKRRLKDTIIEMITQNGVTHFISGMAIGIDMYAAEIVLKLKETYPNISLEAAIPCENQSAKWAEQLRNRYNDILEKCDIALFFSIATPPIVCTSATNIWLIIPIGLSPYGMVNPAERGRRLSMRKNVGAV